MNYSKKSTSRKQKALKSKKKMMKKKLGVVFLKTLLVLVIALGVAGVCGGSGSLRRDRERAGYYKRQRDSPRIQIYGI